MRFKLLVVSLMLLAGVGVAFGQGTQTGVVSGTVSSSDGAMLPNVSITITSPALIGTRTAVSDAHGGYIFRALPPGVYKITYVLKGFGTVEKSFTLQLGASIPLDASLSVAAVTETVNVTAEAPTPLTTTQVGADYTKQMLDQLPTGRDLFGIAQLSPGLTTNTPNAGQVTIGGNFAYDNVFLLDGADVDDNLFGSANTIFIEDAIEETQVLTSGISAEYGRFGGGVINAVTKRGGDKFSGSARINLTNPSWIQRTPYEKNNKITRKSALSKFWEGTLGGPIVKRRLWFFLAGRKEASTLQQTLPASGSPFSQVRDQKRYEGKLSGAIAANHNVTATYIGVSDKVFRETFGFSIDPVHTAYHAQQPQHIFVLNYAGTLRSNLFAEAQYSQKYFEFKNSGGTSTQLVDSPFFTLDGAYHYNAPYFDASDPEQRNNRQFTVALSYFLSTAKLGKHDIKVGFENYRSQRTGGNSQSATGYVIYADYVADDAGRPILDAQGYDIPIFEPGVNRIQHWMPTKGAKINLTTQSAYINDKWALDRHFSFNIGFRAEWAKGDATGGIQPVNTSGRIVPRLGASFDVLGNGKFKLDATYAQYAGKYSETQFANNTNVGNPDVLYYDYTGPAGEGRSFAPGFDPKNYTILTGGVFSTANVFYDKNIKSPVTKEWTGQFGVDLGKGRYVKAIYTWRKVSDFVQVFVNKQTGITDVVKNGESFGEFSNRLWANSNDGLREYSGLQFQVGVPVTPKFRVDAHYTLMLKNDGNQEGEAANQPGAPSPFPGFYPELFDQARSYPIGHLVGFQRHRARVFATYDLDVFRRVGLNLGAIYRFDSGTAYSIRSTSVGLTSVQEELGAAAGYPDLPSSQTVFYIPTGRGSEKFNDVGLADLAVTANVKTWRTILPWFKVEFRNVFNHRPLVTYNISTTPSTSQGVDNLGLGNVPKKGKSFGLGTAAGNWPNPREFRMSAGIRF